MGFILDSKLTLDFHTKTIMARENKTIGLTQKFQRFLAGVSSVTIYKAFIRPTLDLDDIIFDPAFNESIHWKMESFQFKAALAITRTIRGTSKEKL